MKPKSNRKGPKKRKANVMDMCQTPAYALDPLLPFIKPFTWVWEPAAGEGVLVRALEHHGFGVVSGDIQRNQNFFLGEPLHYDVQVTNPPYTTKLKIDWINRSFDLDKPFALLIPIETIGTLAQQRMERCGGQFLWLNKRVNFKMPNIGWEGSTAQFPVFWLCYKLLPAPVMYGKIDPKNGVIDYAFTR